MGGRGRGSTMLKGSMHTCAPPKKDPVVTAGVGRGEGGVNCLGTPSFLPNNPVDFGKTPFLPVIPQFSTFSSAVFRCTKA